MITKGQNQSYKCYWKIADIQQTEVMYTRRLYEEQLLLSITSKAQGTSTWKTFKVLLHFFPVLDVSFTRYRGFFNTIKVLLLRLNCCSSFGSMVVFIGKEINSVNNQILLTVSFFDQELDLNTSPANSYTRERVCAIL